MKLKSTIILLGCAMIMILGEERVRAGSVAFSKRISPCDEQAAKLHCPTVCKDHGGWRSSAPQHGCSPPMRNSFVLTCYCNQ